MYLYILHRFIAMSADSWTVEEVCEWLEEKGLGEFKDTFVGEV